MNESEHFQLDASTFASQADLSAGVQPVHPQDCQCGCHQHSPQKAEIKFPCHFPLKAFALASDDLLTHTLELLKPLVPGLKEEHCKVTSSSKGKYMSVTVTFEASSREQLDNIYLALKNDPRILTAL